MLEFKKSDNIANIWTVLIKFKKDKFFGEIKCFVQNSTPWKQKKKEISISMMCTRLIRTVDPRSGVMFPSLWI